MLPVGRGAIMAWPGMSLWIGAALGPAGNHAHHAIQITLVLDGTVRFRMIEAQPTDPIAGAIIASGRVHAFEAAGATVALIFVEPESAPGRALQALCGEAGFVQLDALRAAGVGRRLAEAWAGGRERDALVEAAEGVVAAIASGAAPVAAVDARIVRVLELIRLQLAQPLRIGSVARAVHLSPGRLRHLFVEQTGITFRGYVLWQRMQCVLRALEAGATLTDAAHAAGFADSAHLTRTFRRMFGIAPSAMSIEP